MPLANTPTSYGLVARMLHWLTALLIFVAFPLGYIANTTPLTDEAAIARVFQLFSLHKTVGVMALLIGLARIGWSLTQPRPAPLSHTHWERALAALTHWTLTIALVAVPLTGWLAHSAAPGLAPILWPFGQHLPFVPATPGAAAALGQVHGTVTTLLAAAVILHIAGALKHSLVDRDATLARMTRGTPAGTGERQHETAAILSAIALWAAALAIGLTMGLIADRDRAEPPREWPLAEARIAIADNAGTVLAEAESFDLFLALAPETRRPEKGTLEITLPLDAMDGPGIDRVLAAAPFPLLTFSGTVTGTSPGLTATGLFDLAGITSEAAFSVTTDDTGATLSGSVPFPGAPDLTLTLDARALRD